MISALPVSDRCPPSTIRSDLDTCIGEINKLSCAQFRHCEGLQKSPEIRATHQGTFLNAKLQVRYAPGVRYALGQARYGLGVLPRTSQKHIQILLSSIKTEVGFCPWFRA